MNHFCTYFDRNYIHKGLALYDSLVRAGDPFVLWILCFDSETEEALAGLKLANVRLVSQADFEADDDALTELKKSRTLVEYYWTSTPSLPLYVFRQDPSTELLVYLDADIFFYSSPAAIRDELGDGNILIVPHDYSREFEERLVNGTYNVGIIAFRRNDETMRCLRWWRDRCLEWCFYRLENGQMGDQKYLEDWPRRFEGVVICRNPGINAAPWNVAKYRVGKDESGRLCVGGPLLVCYHFHSCAISNRFLAHISGFQVEIAASELALIYRPYLDALVRAESLLASAGTPISIPKSGIPWRYIIGRAARRQPIRHFMRMSRRPR